MPSFKAPKSALGEIDAEAAALIAAAADIAMIVDDRGVVRDLSISAPDLAGQLRDAGQWRGRKLADVVTTESRPKVDALLADAAARAETHWRHINHPATAGPDVPISYAAARAGAQGRTVVFGRDLRPLSSLQRRLADAQQAMERDYADARLAETRYRLLFHIASDAVLIVEGASRRVLDSNPSARRLFGKAAEPGTEWRVADLFAADATRSIEHLFAGVQASGRADDVRAVLSDGNRDVIVALSPFREQGGLVCMVRITTPQTGAAEEVISKLKAKLLKLMERAPDGFVVTGDDGRIITANAAFLDLVQMPTEEQVRGETLDRWIGRSGVELDVLTANLRKRGSVRLFATTLNGEFGESTDVEISAVTVMNGGKPCFGFAIRDIGRRVATEPTGGRTLPHSFDRITELIGRVALKDLVREATDVIERLCIEAALELTSNNRASAAEMLGLSRQSLYVKLHRYGLDDPAGAGAD